MTSTPEHAGNAFSWRFTTPLFIGSALNPINSSVIATALVPIAAGVHVSVGETAILVTALYLASSVAQPTWGKLSEEFGPRRMFLAGIVLVLIGGVVGGAGRNLTTLVVARALIGIGTSAGYPSAMLLIRRRAASAGLDAPPGGVLGGLQISGMVTAAVGLPLGGVLVGAFGWRSTFLINIPVALVTLGMAARWLPRDAPVEGARSAREIAARIDVAGIAGFAAAMIALLTFLFSLQHPNWVALGLAAVLFGALVGWELRTRDPFIDMRLVASNLALTRTYLRFALTSLVIYTVLYGLAQWLEVGRGISAQEAGLLILPMSVLSAVIARPISQRNLVRSPLIAAAGSSLVASLGLLFLTTSTAIILIVAVTLVFGVTLGTMSVGNQTALYTQVTAEQIGTVSGLFRTFGYIGSVGSSAIIAIVFHRSVTDHGLHVIAVIMIAASAAVLLMTLADRGIMTLARAGEATPPPATQQPEQEKHQERTGDHALVRTRPARAPAHGPLRLTHGNKLPGAQTPPFRRATAQPLRQRRQTGIPGTTIKDGEKWHRKQIQGLAGT